MMKRWSGLFACLAVVAQLAFVESAASPVRIAFPTDGEIITGPVTLRAEVDPSASIARAVFFVDGKEVCSVATTPVACDWDAGPSVAARQVRLVVNLAGGGRVVQSVRTAALEYAESVDVDVVQVSVSVTDEHGQYVRGLPQSAFHITENGRPQPISHFYSEEAPLELVVAIDVSASMKSAMPTMKKAVAGLLAAVPPTHCVTLLAFNDEVFAVAPNVKDLRERAKVVDQLIAWGSTALYESMAEGVRILGAKPGRKAMLVFTDGEDRGSLTTVEEVEQDLQSSNLALYMIGQGEGLMQDRLKKLMHRLARPTGGRALSTNRIDQLQESFTDLLDEMSNQYVLAYAPTNLARDGSWREITVTVDGHDRVRARQGYRAATK
jgi:VWFA-related protein